MLLGIPCGTPCQEKSSNTGYRHHAMWIILLLIFLGLSNVSSWAQSEQETQPTILDTQAPSLRFEHQGIADGLRGNFVTDMVQDSLGYIWMATRGGGLHRYDGYGFEVYSKSPFDSSSISTNEIQGISLGQKGKLWIATTNGLNRFNRETETFTTFKHDPQDSTSLTDNNISYTLQASNGDLWVGTVTDGLNRMPANSPGTFIHYRHDPNNSNTISSDIILGIKEGPEGDIWVGTLMGLNRIDPQTDEITHYVFDPKAEEVSRYNPNLAVRFLFAPNQEGIIWVATGQGLVRLNYKTKTHRRFYLEPDDIQSNPANRFTSVEPDPNIPGILWLVGTTRGLVRFDTRSGTFTVYDHDPTDPNSLADDLSTRILTDRTGKMWIGHYTRGVSSFNPSSGKFNHIQNDPNDKQSLAPGLVWGILEDTKGRLWISTQGADANLTRVDPRTGNVRRFYHDPENPNTIQDELIATIFEDATRDIWVGGRYGISHYDEQTEQFQRYQIEPYEENFYKNDVLDIESVADSDTELWIGSSGGLLKFNLKSKRFTEVSIDVPKNRPLGIIDLKQGVQGNLWIGTQTSGLLRMTPDGKVISEATHDSEDTTSISSNFITNIIQQSQKPRILWLSTADGGLNRYDRDSGTTTHYMMDDGLPSNALVGMLEDDSGTFWISTKRGISNFDPQTEQIRNYGLEDGLIALEYVQNALAKANNGTFYFGSTKGVTAFDPAEIEKNSTPPQVAISGFKIANHSVTPGPDSPLKTNIEDAQHITVPYEQGEITFEYVALHYANPKKNTYAYQLDGFDEEWVEAGTKRSVDYTNLEPGTYTFRVKAANADGVWNNKGASVQLTVLPPWYRTWWAYGLFTILIGFVGFGIDRLQRKRLRKKERERSELREAELRAEEENKRREDTEQLSKIGRAVTSSLAVEEIIETIYQNVNDLMDAAVFGVGIYNDQTGSLNFPATKEKGKTLPAYSYDLNDENRLAVYCFKHREDVVLANYPEQYTQYISNYVPPSEGEDTVSVVYLPLVYQNETIGVLTTQSFEFNAFSDYHVNLLRNLATYAAIALDNAEAYRQLNKTLQELQDAQEQLVQQEKLASLGQLTAGIAHEIKNPLNFVNNFSDLSTELIEELGEELSELKSNLTSEHPQVEEMEFLLRSVEANLSKIYEHGSRADGIVKSMLEHSRGGSGTKEPTDINALVKEYVNLSFHGMRASSDPINVDLEYDLSDEIPEVPLIAEDFSRVIVNLSNNAFDAMREKQENVDFSPQLTLRTYQHNGAIKIEIEDNGPGMSPEIRDKILQPFFTTKKGTQGTGLGLSITHDIVKAHGGSLDITSTQGSGTTFTVTIPQS
jgi:signal transduction histidine kinase/ligand-binding sensor domain-containing protein